MTGERGGATGRPTCGHWLCGLQKRRMIRRPIGCGEARLRSIPVGICRLTATRWTSAAASLCPQRRVGLMPRRYGFRRGCTIPGDTRRGAQKVIDRSAERAKLGQLAVQEAGEIRRSRQMLATGRRLRLSQLDELPEGASQLFLDLLRSEER